METFYYTKVSLAKEHPDEGSPLSLRNLFIKLLHGHVSARGIDSCKIAICFGKAFDIHVYSIIPGALDRLIEDLSQTGLFRDHLCFSGVSIIDCRSHEGSWLEIMMLRPPRKTSFSKVATENPKERERWAEQRKKELEKLPYFIGRSNSTGHAFKNYVKVQKVDGFKGFNVNSYGLGTLNAPLTVPQVNFES